MVMDSLRYWANEFHIDGFRFDLGVTLGRERHGFDPGAGFFDAIRQDPVLSELKLISEPWDVGPGGYQLGNHPPGFAEWNDRYRDGVRRFWRGDAGQRPDLAARLSGSGDVFDKGARRPWASINYLASHDGFTLNDVVSYAEKHNEANGEDNRDGHSENYSGNWGAEGPTDDKAVRGLRARVMRSMLLTLFASQGTPMLLAGDEFGRTQEGNNNAYCQDNEISWLDWPAARKPAAEALSQFTARLITLRKRHRLMRAGKFLYGREELAPGVRDIDWFDERGQPLSPGDWNNPEGKALAMRRAEPMDLGQVRLLALLLNASAEPLSFNLAPPDAGWTVLIDSAAPDANKWALESGQIEVMDRSAVLLTAILKPKGV